MTSEFSSPLPAPVLTDAQIAALYEKHLTPAGQHVVLDVLGFARALLAAGVLPAGQPEPNSVDLRSSAGQPSTAGEADLPFMRDPNRASFIGWRDAIYVDSTPLLQVGDSAFEDWYANYPRSGGPSKQLARDAYAAGMGDPLVTYATPVAQPARSASPDQTESAPPALMVPVGWMPIASAPKGKLGDAAIGIILGFAPDEENYSPGSIEGFWNHHLGRWSSTLDPGWTSSPQPTHWMPLPAPPKEQQ